MKSNDDGNYYCIFWGDISKAFDSPCYNGLLHKLNLKYMESLNQFRNGLLAFF